MESPGGAIERAPAAPGGAARPSEGSVARASIWALAGGKGGVGRSLLAANLAIQIARGGRRVVLVDLDLQGSNLHTYLGYQRLPRSLADLAAGRVALLSELACETPTSHLRLIGGLQRADLQDDPVHFVRQVAEQFGHLSADHVIVDCGSGRTPATIATFSEATVGILVSTPEPASLESVYLFTQAYLRWCLTRALTGEAMARVESRLRDAGSDPARLSFRAFMTRLGSLDPEAREAIARVVRRTRLELLLNQVRGEGDEESAAALASGFRKCFGLNLQVAGIIEHDLSVLQSVQKRRPLSQQYPNASSTKGIGRAANRLLAVAVGPLREEDEEWEDLETIDHYRVLEVVPKASPKEVQSAYQLLKKTYDPETTVLAPILEAPGLREMQARIEAAYRTLIFLESRSTYDRQMLERGTVRDDQLRGLHGAPSTAPAADATAPAPRISSLEPAGGSPGEAARAADAPAAGTAPPAPAGDRPEGTPAAEAAAAETAAPAPRAGAGATAGAPPTPADDTAPPGSAPAGPDTAPAAADRSCPGSGPELRDERLRRKLTLASIVERTKIRPAYLQAIEEERFGDLPAAVFVRGFLREYARCLGAPGEEVTRLYMRRYRDWQESKSQPAPLAGRSAGD
jgi:flagellar biosynthesis protein FlhG